MITSDVQSMPEAECEILVKEKEKTEGHVSVNPFSQDFPVQSGKEGERSRNRGYGRWELLGSPWTRSGSDNGKALGSPGREWDEEEQDEAF